MPTTPETPSPLVMPMTANEQRRMELLVSGLQLAIVFSYCAAVYAGILDVSGWWRPVSTIYVVAIQVPQIYYMLRYRARGATVRWVEQTIHFTDITAISVAWLAVDDPDSFIWVVYLYALVGYSRRLRGIAYAIPAAFIVVNLLAVSFYLNQREGIGPITGNLAVEAVVSISMALLAHMIGAAWLRAENRARVLSETDPLTGISNRRFFLERLEAFAAADQAVYSVLMLDLDNFKRLNDELGHLAGDEALVRVAQTLQSTVHQEGNVARYGGEEFIVLMPGAGPHRAASLARELCHAVAANTPTTVSIGVATRQSGESPDAVISRADELLGLAKRSGKNMVRTDGNADLSA